MDSRPVERFRRVDVSDTHDHRGVHQEVLDRGRPAASQVGESSAVEPGRQRFHAEMAEVPVPVQALR